jgi:hypothetical protein
VDRASLPALETVKLPWRLQADEDFPHDVVEALENHGFFIRRPRRRQLGIDDPDWLSWCYENDFVILTCNVKDFRRLNEAWAWDGRLHCGVIGVPYQDHTEMTAGLLDLLTSRTPNDVVAKIIVVGEDE